MLKSLLPALVMPILISVIAVYSSYWFKPVDSFFSSQYVYVISSSVVGSYFFSNVVIHSPIKKLLAWLAFAVYLIFAIFWSSLLAACTLGDCL
jgi:hypothetical protein